MLLRSTFSMEPCSPEPLKSSKYSLVGGDRTISRAPESGGNALIGERMLGLPSRFDSREECTIALADVEAAVSQLGGLQAVAACGVVHRFQLACMSLTES